MVYIFRVPEYSLPHIFFRIGMLWRIVYGFVRIILGFTLFRLIGHPLVDAFHYVMSFELAESHRELIIAHADNFLARHPVQITTFLAVYFIFWGITDIIVSFALIKDKMWAFHVAYYIMIPFMMYECIRLLKTGSLTLAYIIIVDIAILYLIRKEHLAVVAKKMNINS